MSAKEKEGANKADVKEHSPSTQRRPSTVHPNASGTASPSSSSFSSLRIIVLLLSALVLYISTQGFFSEEYASYPSSSSPSSSFSSKQHHRRGDEQIKFGVPTEQLVSSNSASSGHYYKEQEQREQQKQQRQQERQQRQQNPFGDFFGHQEEPEAQQEYDEACPGYVCSEGGACVETPIQCPCPYELDTKCFQGDWYVCHRGEHTCLQK